MRMLAADRRSARHLAWLACVLAVLSGCATWNMPADTSDTPFRARAITETKRGVQLSATVLDAQDSLRLFGTDVTAAGIQPVWIEVRNDTEQVFWLLRSGTDPDYFSPLEVAWSAHVKLGGETNARIDEHFDRLAFPNPIPAHGANSGILFTNPQPVTKLLNVDLLGNKSMVPFTLFLPVRGDVARAGEQIHRYADSEISRYDDLEALRRALESLPCCAGTDAGAAAGDPLNVVLVGDLDDIGAAFVRRGYRRNPTGVGTVRSGYSGGCRTFIYSSARKPVLQRTGSGSGGRQSTIAGNSCSWPRQGGRSAVDTFLRMRATCVFIPTWTKCATS